MPPLGAQPRGFDIVASVNVMVTDDIAAARDAMRPFIALYVGGMGSRDHNFYNQLVGRYGFEDAAADPGPLPAGNRSDAMAAIADELIDMVTLAGPPDVCATGCGPTATPASGPSRSPRWAGRRTRRSSSAAGGGARRPVRLLLGAFGDPGHASR